MKAYSTSRWLFAGAFFAAAFAGQAVAQEKQDGAVTATAAVVLKSDEAQPAAPSKGVTEVLKMLDAKVSKDVIKAYVESSPMAFNLTAANVVALKDHGASDDVTTAMLKRGAENRAHALQAGTEYATSQVPAGSANSAAVAPRPLDMDSYEFFEQNYLMPRTMASINDRLGYVTMPYGYYPAPVGPYSGFAQQRGFGFNRPFTPFTPFRDGRFR